MGSGPGPEIVGYALFYVSPANIGDQITIHGDEARHIARVLRLQPQEMIIAFDGSGYDYEVKLLSVSSDEVTGTVFFVFSIPLNLR